LTAAIAAAAHIRQSASTCGYVSSVLQAALGSSTLQGGTVVSCVEKIGWTNKAH